MVETRGGETRTPPAQAGPPGGRELRRAPAPASPRWRPGRTAAQGGALVALALVGWEAARHGLDPAVLGLGALAIGFALLQAAGTAHRAERPDTPEASRERSILEWSLLAKVPEPIIVVDRRVVVREANDAARKLLPALKEGHPLSFALRDPNVLDGIDVVLRAGEPVEVDLVLRLPALMAFEVRIGAAAIGAGGNAVEVVLFFRDVTAARRAERMRVDFVANVSHELRTPLASLLGFIDTLEGPARDDAAARERFLAIMREQAGRMARLIDELLSLSRIELRAHLQPEGAVDLVPLVRHVVDALAPVAREWGVAIEVIAPETALAVRGDRDELVRVVENLVENAVKYGESGGRVEVRLGRVQPGGSRPGAAELSVRDFGPGIAPEHLPRLTERFYRVDVAQSRQKGGTGLGLAIVKHIVNRHRGRLSIESELDRGATFRVLLPEHPGGRCHGTVTEPS